MKKIFLFLLILIVSLLINGCKPSFNIDLAKNIVYYEKCKLIGENKNFFIEVIVGEKENLPFCDIILTPKNINLENYSYSFVYADIKGNLTTEPYHLQHTCQLGCNSLEDKILIEYEGNEEEINLFPLTKEYDKLKILEIAKSHFQEKINSETADKNFEKNIYIKILADINNIPYLYIGFVDEKEYYAVLIDPETLKIVVDYIS